MTVWRRADGTEWGQETTTAAVKGTVWGFQTTQTAPVDGPTILETPDFPCQVCGKVAKSAAGLAAHARSHK